MISVGDDGSATGREQDMSVIRLLRFIHASTPLRTQKGRTPHRDSESNKSVVKNGFDATLPGALDDEKKIQMTQYFVLFTFDDIVNWGQKPMTETSMRFYQTCMPHHWAISSQPLGMVWTKRHKA